MQDEPSAGVDPAARRKMWSILQSRRHGRATVLTTHIMEEASALSNRIGIMVNGRMSCLGSPQRLRDLYGKGYQVNISCTGDESILRKIVGELALALAGGDAASSHATWHTDASSANGRESAIQGTAPPLQHHRIRVHVAEHHMGWARIELDGDMNYGLPILFRSLMSLKTRSFIPDDARNEIDLHNTTSESDAISGKLIDFTVSQCSLEQIFIDLTRSQQEDTGH